MRVNGKGFLTMVTMLALGVFLAVVGALALLGRGRTRAAGVPSFASGTTCTDSPSGPARMATAAWVSSPTSCGR